MLILKTHSVSRFLLHYLWVAVSGSYNLHFTYKETKIPKR